MVPTSEPLKVIVCKADSHTDFRLQLLSGAQFINCDFPANNFPKRLYICVGDFIFICIAKVTSAVTIVNIWCCWYLCFRSKICVIRLL